MSAIKVGIIGGSGLSNPDLLQDRKEKHVDTPFGKVCTFFFLLEWNKHVW